MLCYAVVKWLHKDAVAVVVVVVVKEEEEKKKRRNDAGIIDPKSGMRNNVVIIQRESDGTTRATRNMPNDGTANPVSNQENRIVMGESRPGGRRTASLEFSTRN